MPAVDPGMDVSVGYSVGALLGEWPTPGAHGAGTARVDLFTAPYTTASPRLGASVWGRSAVWPLQEHGGVAFDLLQYGLHAVLRHDPARRWTGTFGFGFSRLDLSPYDGGVHTIPVFTVEAGLRQEVRGAFVDYGVSSGWGSARGADADWEDWWTVTAGVAVGVHAR